jgi:hypothetical protein
MRYVTIRACIAAVILALATAACGIGNGNGTSVSQVTQSTGIPNVTQSTGVAKVTLTVPGHPSAQVTDVTARGLTQAQLNTLIAKCNQGAGVPGTSNGCSNLIPDLLKLPPCNPVIQPCVYVGRVVGLNLGILQIIDQRPGGSACGGDVAPCHGVILSAGAIAALGAAAPTPETTSGSPAPTPTPTPTVTVTPTPTITGPPPSPEPTPTGS